MELAQNPVKMFGAYVSSLSTSVGWGGQGGSMQLKIVEDPENGVNITLPAVGSACYFKYGSFYYGGIFQRWTYQESVSGGRTYDVILESPSKLMDGVQIIVGEFNGMSDLFHPLETPTTNAAGSLVNYDDIANVYNIFGFFENDVDGFFGSSHFNTAGLKVNMLLYALDKLASAPYYDTSSAEFGDTGFGGPIQFEETDFDLNISNLKSIIDSVWGEAKFAGFDGMANFYSAPECYRLKGPTLSIEGLVSDLADALQFDYYYDVRHKDFDETNYESQYDDGGGVIESAEVNIKIVSKAAPPNPGAIQEYITSEKDSGNVISYSVGQEFADNVTQKMVVGATRDRYQFVPISLCYPVWGKMENGGLLTSNLRSGYYVQGSSASLFGAGPDKPDWSRTIRLTRNNNFNSPHYYASLLEIRMALGGKECWEIFKTFETIAGVEPNGENNILRCPWTAQFDVANDFLKLLNSGSANCFDFINTNLQTAFKSTLKSKNEEADEIFSLVSGVANNFYCQQFVVPLLADLVNGVPIGRLLYAPPGEFQVWKANEISDSAFIETKLCRDLEFFDGEGKTKAMSAFPTGIGYDYSNLGSDYGIGLGPAAGTIVSTKGSPGKDQFFQFSGSNLLYVHFQTGGQVKYFDAITTPDFGLTVLAKYFFNLNITPDKYITSGKQSLQFAIPPDVATPKFAGIPEENTRHRYGPWLGGTSLRGKAEVVVDESLTPETFGSYNALKEVGRTQALMGTAKMTAMESGMVEVVGAPQGNIGERFASSGPYVTNMDISVDTSGIKTTFKFNTWTPNFGKLAKYNIDRIARINKNSFAQAKRNRDRIEKRPFPKIKFEKTDFATLAARFSRTDISGIAFSLKGNADVNIDNTGKSGGGNAGQPGLDPGGHA
tara:strand:- start:62284 stop:64956 length:2673 start_codon:yes stop_codon:yes gene_type:complete